MRCMIHVTKECKTVEEAEWFYGTIKKRLSDLQDVHLNGQVTVKFQPSHAEHDPEEGPPS